jgi:hypothetical protein
MSFRVSANWWLGQRTCLHHKAHCIFIEELGHSGYPILVLHRSIVCMTVSSIIHTTRAAAIIHSLLLRFQVWFLLDLQNTKENIQ